MYYQIRDGTTNNIVDQNLSHDEALLWIDNSIGSRYIMEPMKENDQK